MLQDELKELLQYIAQHLVDEPDAVNVTVSEHGEDLVMELRVASGDMGKVIGRQGRVAKEIRTLMKAVSQRQDKKVSVQIVE